MIKTNKILSALGGQENIYQIIENPNRLTVSVHSTDIINETALRSEGVLAVVIRCKEIEVVIGPDSGRIIKELEEYL